MFESLWNDPKLSLISFFVKDSPCKSTILSLLMSRSMLESRIPLPLMVTFVLTMTFLSRRVVLYLVFATGLHWCFYGDHQDALVFTSWIVTVPFCRFYWLNIRSLEGRRSGMQYISRRTFVNRWSLSPDHTTPQTEGLTTTEGESKEVPTHGSKSGRSSDTESTSKRGRVVIPRIRRSEGRRRNQSQGVVESKPRDVVSRGLIRR